MKKQTVSIAAAALFAAVVSGCAGSGRFTVPEPLPDDRRHIAEPQEQDISVEADYLEQQVFRQIEDMLDLSRGLRWMTGNRKEAMNVDAFDEVPNSSWFTNRNHMETMSVDAFRRGPDSVDGPDQSSQWTIFRAKSQGVTPGFHIIDGRGDRYVIKFDPPGHQELITGAEVVSTRLFYAAGYHTPENYVVYFIPAILRVGDDVKFLDDRGRHRAMNEGDLARIMTRVPVLADGTVRAVASRYIAGKPVGPFEYDGTRDDDPNDIIPHQHRRELRGLRVIAAWVGHFDTKASNSLDSYVTVGGRSYVRHYLIDFGSTLGAGAEGPVPKFRGHENELDPHAIAFNTATLGLYVRPYEKLGDPPYPSVGRWESVLFNPQEYKFQAPNPAFEAMTHRDAFWGAKIVTSMTDEQLDAAAECGRYSDPAAAAYIARILKERRDKVGRYWFSRVNPLDRFQLSPASSGARLEFSDLAVERGYESAADTRYRFSLERDGRTLVAGEEFTGTAVELDREHFDGAGYDSQWRCRVYTRRGEHGWSKAVDVFIGSDLRLLGVRR